MCYKELNKRQVGYQGNESLTERGRQTEAGASTEGMAGKPLRASQLLAIDVPYNFLVICILCV